MHLWHLLPCSVQLEPAVEQYDGPTDMRRHRRIAKNAVQLQNATLRRRPVPIDRRCKPWWLNDLAATDELWLPSCFLPGLIELASSSLRFSFEGPDSGRRFGPGLYAVEGRDGCRDCTCRPAAFVDRDRSACAVGQEV